MNPAMLARAALLLLCIPFAAAHAQLSRQMDDIFESMSNVSQPGVLNGQLRGVVTGGSVQVRTGVVNSQLVGIAPPHISAGCGGIDAYGGSFSYVNKQAFTDFLRHVASNAAGYAFKLGLKTMCNTCEASMEEIQTKVQEWNKYFRNSCESAQLLVNGAAGSMAANWGASQASVASGAVSDTNEAAKTQPGDTAPAADLKQQNPAAAREIIRGNVMMRALRAYQASSWFSSGNDELLQDIISVTGTVIVCVPDGSDDCPTPRGAELDSRSNEPIVVVFPPILRLTDLVYGVSGSTIAGGNTDIKAYRCGGECNNPQPTSITSMKGMGERVREILVGTSTDGGGGLIGKLRHNTGAITAQERGFAASAGIYTGLALSLAGRNEEAARNFASTFAADMAAEMVVGYLERVIQASSIAVSLHGTDAGGKMDELLATARANLHADRATISNETKSAEQALSYYMLLSRALPSPDLPARPYQLGGGN